MLEPLTIGLVAAALGGEGLHGADDDAGDAPTGGFRDPGDAPDAEAFRDAGGYPEPVAALATGFWGELGDDLRSVAREFGNDASDERTDPDGSGSTAFDPASAVAALSSVDASFRDELDAVARILDALAGATGIDATDPRARGELGLAVVGACRATVAGADALAGTALAGELGLAGDRDLDAAVAEAVRRFDRLAAGFRRPGHVEVVEPGGDLARALHQRVADPTRPFVDRPELDRRVVPRARGPASGPAAELERAGGDPRTGVDDPQSGGPPVRTVLVVGGTGAGKSRTLVELLDRIAEDRPVVAAFPTGTGRHPADLGGLDGAVEAALPGDEPGGPAKRGGGPADDARDGPADDDGEGSGATAEVVVVLDDAGAVAPRTGNAAVRTLDERASELAAAGHRVRVLLAADADRVPDLPGGRDDPADPLWAGSETVDLGELGADTLAALFEAALDRHGVDADDGTVRALAEEAERVDPTPFYVESVAERAAAGRTDLLPGTADPPASEGGDGTGEEREGGQDCEGGEGVVDPPPDAGTLWREAYDRLGGDRSAVLDGDRDGTRAERADDPSAPQRVLKAASLLAETGAPSPYHSGLLAGVYEHVFGGHPGAFAPAIRSLGAEGWVEVVDAGDPSGREGVDRGGPGEDPSGERGELGDSGRDPVDSGQDLGDPAEAVAGGGRPLDGPVGVGVAYRIHRGKLDAVPLAVDRHLDALLALYADRLERSLEPADARLAELLPGPDPRLVRALRDGLATALFDRGEERAAERGFERLVAGIDPDGDLPRFEYSLLLGAAEDEGSAGEAGDDDGDPAAPVDDPRADDGDTGVDDGDPAPAAGDPAAADGDTGTDGIPPASEDLDPELARPHRDYAARLAAADDRTAAATHYERALGIDPDDPATHRGYANLLTGEDADRARAHYERALELAPDDPDLHREYADLQAGEDRASAVAHYERALELAPGDAEAHYGYATLLFEDGEEDAAAEHYERAIDADPDHARARYNYALLCRGRGEGGAAAEHLERAVDSWVRRGRPDAAVEDLATLVEVLLDRGRVGAAREACERGLALIDRAGLSPNAYAVRWIESEALRLDLLEAADVADGDAASEDADSAAGGSLAADLSRLYETALLHQVAGDDRRALFLLATVWDRRSAVDPGSAARADAAAAGTALAVHLRAMDRPGVGRPEGILARIEVGTDVDPDPGAILAAVEPRRKALSEPVRPVYEFLAGDSDDLAGEGTEVTPEAIHAMAAGSLPEDLGRETLEPHVFATLLDSLVEDDDPF